MKLKDLYSLTAMIRTHCQSAPLTEDVIQMIIIKAKIKMIQWGYSFNVDHFEKIIRNTIKAYG